MATIPQKDVLIEFISGTMIDIRYIGTDEDKTKLATLRIAVYSQPCAQINYDKFIKEIRKIRLKYEIESKGRKMLSTENTMKLRELKIFGKVIFEFKDGWTDLVYQLGKDITELCELTKCELPYIQQIKEKMGTLRFYFNCLNSSYPEIVEKSIRALVFKAETNSASTCEYCGKWGETRTNGIVHTSCEEHKLENSFTLYEHRVLFEKQQNKRKAERLAPEFSI